MLACTFTYKMKTMNVLTYYSKILKKCICEKGVSKWFFLHQGSVRCSYCFNAAETISLLFHFFHREAGLINPMAK